jgi:DNA invertase Pin-like site-specific DNA recombinase
VAIFGYTRVLPNHQILAHEHAALKKAGVSEAFTESAPVGQSKRPALKELVDRCTAGDVVVVSSLNRLGRSIDEILNTVTLIHNGGIHLVSLADEIDTRLPHGAGYGSFLGAIEKARAHLAIELTQRGMHRVAASGKRIGRPPINPEGLRIAIDMVLTGATLSEAAKQTGCSVATLHRYLTKQPPLR